MRQNTIALGEKHLEGDYHRIIAAGGIWLKDSKTKSVYTAGDIDIENSCIRKIYSAGDLTAKAVTIGLGKIAGNLTLQGICKADKLMIAGGISAEYLECKCLRNGSNNSKVNNTLCWSGFIKAETFESVAPFLLDLDYEFTSMIISGSLRSNSEIACTNFYGLDQITAPCINADLIVLLTTEGTEVRELVGSQIIVETKFKPDKTFKSIPKTLRYNDLYSDKSLITIEAISGDKVIINSVKANSVSGIDVVIGDLCIVDEVVYQKSIKVSDKAVVGRVVKQ